MLPDVQNRPNQQTQVPELREISIIDPRVTILAIGAITTLGVILSFTAATPMAFIAIWLGVGTANALLIALNILNCCCAVLGDD